MPFTLVMSSNELIFWLGLKFISGVGNQTALRLLEHFGGSARAIFEAAPEELRTLGLKSESLKAIRHKSWESKANFELESLKRQAVEVVVFSSSNYPSWLKQIYNPPVLFYAKGNIDLLREPGVAIVGTRRATLYGLNIASRLAEGLAERGLVVVSGMARGIDTAAHKGALRTSARTIAVLGCGVDVIYPPENKGLYNQIIDKGGLVISEYPLGSHPLARHFPARNRLISGLSLGVVVVEAALKSGSLITARLALEQGREVFAVPGPADSIYSQGPHFLIRQGAKLVERVEDILEELPLKNVTSQPVSNVDDLNPPFDPLTNEIVSLLETPKNLEEIVLTLGKDVAIISAKLTLLEIQGIVQRLPQGQFLKAD